MLRKLVAFMTISEGMTIGFVDSPSSIETHLLLDFLGRELAENVDLVLVEAAEPGLRFLLDNLCRRD